MLINKWDGYKLYIYIYSTDGEPEHMFLCLRSVGGGRESILQDVLSEAEKRFQVEVAAAAIRSMCGMNSMHDWIVNQRCQHYWIAHALLHLGGDGRVCHLHKRE